MLSADWNAVHTDALSTRDSEFGGRIVHGALGLMITTGIVQRSGMFEGSAVALLGFSDWVFDRPLRVGDTVFTRHADRSLAPDQPGRPWGRYPRARSGQPARRRDAARPQ